MAQVYWRICQLAEQPCDGHEVDSSHFPGAPQQHLSCAKRSSKAEGAGRQTEFVLAHQLNHVRKPLQSTPAWCEGWVKIKAARRLPAFYIRLMFISDRGAGP